MAISAEQRKRGEGSDPAVAVYDAFISYSHAADGRLAPGLQAGLQSLAKPWYRRRALRIFRDKSSLSASPGLWPSIERALERSRFFVLLASSEAARSRWVEQEVAWWRAERTSESCLIVLTDGELGWDASVGDFSGQAGLPPSMRGWFTDEPLWVDLRWARDESHVSARNVRFRDAVAEVASPVRGVSKDALVGEDVRQHRRTTRLAIGVAVLLAVLAVGATVAGFVAVGQRNSAREQSSLATARQISSTAVGNIGSRLDVAQLLAAEGYTRVPISQTSAALFQTAAVSPHLVRFADSGSPVSSLAAAPDAGIVYIGAEDGSVRVWDPDQSGVGPELDHLDGSVRSLRTSNDGRWLAAGGTRQVVVHDLRAEQSIQVSTRDVAYQVAVSDTGRWLAYAETDFISSHNLVLYDLSSRAVVRREPLEAELSSLGFDASESELRAGTYAGSMERRSLPTLRVVQASPANTPAGGYTAAYSPDGRWFGYYKFGVVVSDADTGAQARHFPFASRASASVLAIAPGGERVAVASAGTITVLRPRPDGSVEMTADQGGLIADPFTGVSSETTQLAFVGGTSRVVSASREQLALWDIDQDSRLATRLPVEFPDGNTAVFRPGLGVTPDGRTVAWFNSAATLGVYGGGRMRTVDASGYASAGDHLGLSLDGSKVVLSGHDGITIWDVAAGEPKLARTIEATNDAVYHEWHALGGESMLGLTASGEIGRLSLATGELEQLVPPVRGEDVWQVRTALADDASEAFQVVARYGGSLVEPLGDLYRVDLPSAVRTPWPSRSLGLVSGIAVSRDGQLVAAADGEASLVLVDAASGSIIRTLDVGRAQTVAFSPDARMLATLTDEGALGFWLVADGTKLGEVRLRNYELPDASGVGDQTTLRFASNDRLWTATEGGGLLEWALSEEHWIRLACASAGRALSAEEWERYIGAESEPEFKCAGE